jgi:hypothetical protein
MCVASNAPITRESRFLALALDMATEVPTAIAGLDRSAL